MILKIKLHLLTHLADDARAFGPLIGVATEIFESFNAVFRAASVLSNHRAPSRDIARQLANQEGARLLASGGPWLDPETQEWKKPGRAIRNFMSQQPHLQRMMGWAVHREPMPGMCLSFMFVLSDNLNSPSRCTTGDISLMPLPRRESGKPQAQREEVRITATLARNALNIVDFASDISKPWYKCKSVISKAGDSCSVNSWVFFNISVHFSLHIMSI